MAYCFTDDLNPGREQYRAARRLIRDNGRAALKWMPMYLAYLMRCLMDQRPDPLAERAEILTRMAEFNPTPRQTGDIEQMKRFILRLK